MRCVRDTASVCMSLYSGLHVVSSLGRSARRIRPMRSRSMTMWIDACENGLQTRAIFTRHPKRELHEVHYARCIAALEDKIVLEARCRSPVTLQRDLKRARIVLLAADGRSTRSIAKEVGVQPRIVRLWRHRYVDHGLEGRQAKPRPGKQPIYTKTTDKRILKLLDKPPPQGFARWTGPLLAEALGDVDVQYVWRFLRSHKIDLAGRKS